MLISSFKVKGLWIFQCFQKSQAKHNVMGLIRVLLFIVTGEFTLPSDKFLVLSMR